MFHNGGPTVSSIRPSILVESVYHADVGRQKQSNFISYPILQNTTKGTYNENVLRKNLQKTSEIDIEYSHPNIVELLVVQNMPKMDFDKKIQVKKCRWGIGILLS